MADKIPYTFRKDMARGGYWRLVLCDDGWPMLSVDIERRVVTVEQVRHGRSRKITFDLSQFLEDIRTLYASEP